MIWNPKSFFKISIFKLNLDFNQIYCRTYAYFCIDINVLYVGGPDHCKGRFPSNFTFDDGISPRINIILCGVPQPVVQAHFIGQKLDIVNVTINSYTHNFTLQLPQLTQTTCGRELTVKATGFNGTLTDETKIFLRNCKYDYYVHLIIILGHF